MSDVTKKVARLVPSNERSQVFDQSEVSAGDVILVKESLGKPASRVLIEAVGAMTVRFNVYHVVYASRGPGDDHWSRWSGETRNLSQATTVKDNEGVTHPVAANSTFELQDDIPVSDIEVLTAAGDFTITVM